MKYLKFFLIAFFPVTISYSCYKSKLNQPVPGLLTEQQLANSKGVQGLLVGAYAMLDGVSAPGSLFVPSYGSAGSNWLYGSICGSEAYGGSIYGDQPQVTKIERFNGSSSPADYFFDQKWAAVYEGVQRANSTLRLMRQAKDMSTADTIEVRGEALFLRAFYHFEAKKMWNKIPFVDETITYNAGNYHVVNDTTWKHIENDLIYAMNNLRPNQVTSQGTMVGRANKYAAEALLAKAYMFEHKYDQAKLLLADLISNGQTAGGIKYALLDNYSDNFNIATKNKAESVFAYQSSVLDGVSWGWAGNGNTGDILNNPTGGSTGTCCGFFSPSQYLVNHFRTDPSTGLPDLDNYNNNPVKSDDGHASSDPFTPETGTLDPRLDWTVGRRGIPYLDWGIHPGGDWVRDQDFAGPYSPKKNVFYKGQQGQYVQDQASAVNINFIRFADVLLWAAEVEVEIGSLDVAERYVNLIRGRAANPAGFVHTYVDPANPQGGNTNTNAANYFIKTYPSGYFVSQGQAVARKAVRYERMLELAMEGHRFFDLVRWNIASHEISNYLETEQNLRNYLKGAQFIPDKNEYFPIPQDQIDLSAGPNGVPAMTQNHGY